MKSIAVVILNWNGEQLLPRFLPSVVEHTSSALADIIVADNASTDGSLAYLAEDERFREVRVLKLEENYGFAEGYNRALRRLDYQYFVLLNSDVEVTPRWLEPLYELFEKDSSIAAAQPKILSYRQKTQFEHAGACGGFIDYLGYPFCRGRLFTTLEEDNGQHDSIVDVFWATGAALFIRSCDFAVIGGLDGSFFAHMEEIDLCWRLNARGRRVVCVPQSTVYHLGAATLLSESPRKTYLNFRNNLIMLYKNLPKEDCKRIFSVRLILDVVAGLKMIAGGQFANGCMVFRAINDFHKNRRQYKADQHLNQKQTVVSPIPTIYPRSIVYQYFVKGVKTYLGL